MRILFAESDLSIRRGVSLFTRDLAIRLRQEGHSPVVYAPIPGELQRDLARADVPAIDTLEKYDTVPDVIHGHGAVATIAALLHVSGAPTLLFCHSNQQTGPLLPSVARYVAVDTASRDQILFGWGAPRERVRVLANFVDLERFTPRKPLPPRPLRALVFGSYAADHTGLAAVREACRVEGIALDHVGGEFERSTDSPETLLPHYDLVFASGRCALEALAVGAAVIVLPRRAGPGPLITPDNLARLRSHNFGLRCGGEGDAAYVAGQIRIYDAASAAEVSARVRREAGIDRAVQALLALYHEAIDERAQAPPEPGADARAAVLYLEEVSRRLVHGARLGARHDALRIEHEALRHASRRARQAQKRSGARRGLLRRLRRLLERSSPRPSPPV